MFCGEIKVIFVYFWICKQAIFCLECNKCKHQDVSTTDAASQHLVSDHQIIDYNCQIFNSSFTTGEVETCNTTCFASAGHSEVYMDGHKLTITTAERGCTEFAPRAWKYGKCEDHGLDREAHLKAEGYTNITTFYHECYCNSDRCTDGSDNEGRMDLSKLEEYLHAVNPTPTPATTEPLFYCHECRHIELQHDDAEKAEDLEKIQIIDNNCKTFGEGSSYITNVTVPCNTACFAYAGHAKGTLEDGRLTIITAERGCSPHQGHSNISDKCEDYEDELKGHLEAMGFEDIEAFGIECFCSENECNDGKNHGNGTDGDKLNDLLNSAITLKNPLILMSFIQLFFFFLTML